MGIYTCEALTNVAVKNDIKIGKSYECMKCENESLFNEFCYRGNAYTINGFYRHQNGNVSHFITDIEMVLNQIDNDKTTVLAGVMNIDITKCSYEDVVYCVTTIMAYGYWPYITIPSRIKIFSMTCIDHFSLDNLVKFKYFA